MERFGQAAEHLRSLRRKGRARWTLAAGSIRSEQLKVATSIRLRERPSNAPRHATPRHADKQPARFD